MIRLISYVKMKQAKMKTDYEVCLDGIKALVNTLGSVEAECFIALINREQLDYAEWRKKQWLNEADSSRTGNRGKRAAPPVDICLKRTEPKVASPRNTRTTPKLPIAKTIGQT